MFVNFAYIALGGALGSCLRYAVSLLIYSQNPAGRFPLATLLVNIVGSFIIGVALVNVQRGDVKHFLAVVGFCGAFTTFSAFSAETLEMLKSGEWGIAMGYAALSVVVCVAAVAAGSLIKINN